MQQPLNDMISKINASSLSEDKKAILRDIATKAAETSAAIHARRDELYVGDSITHDVRYKMFEETYALSKPVVDAAHTAATDFKNEIRKEIAGAFDSISMEAQASVINMMLDSQRLEYDALLTESVTLAVRQRTPANLYYTNALDSEGTMDMNIAMAVGNIAAHTHTQPNDGSQILIAPVDGPDVYDKQPFVSDSNYGPSENVVTIGLYASGSTEYDINTGETKFVNEVRATPESVAAVTSHEIGHWLENNKHMKNAIPGYGEPGGTNGAWSVDSTSATLKKLWKNQSSVTNKIDDAVSGKKYPRTIEGMGRAIPYANLIFAYGRNDGSPGYSGSEALSTTLEFLFGAEVGVRNEDSKMRSVVLTDKAVMQYSIGMLSY
jgi:hypothetical protein